MKVDVAGIRTLWQGGVAFDVFEERGEVAGNGARFDLFASEAAARSHIPAGPHSL